jgi:D-alanyl-D-alanine carboxypeptidase
MESLLIFFLLIAAFFPKTETDAAPVFWKSDLNGFNRRLPLAEDIDLPYKIRGAPVFNSSLLAAESVIVADEKTGRVLFEKDSYDKKSIASLTKLMAALVWLENSGDLDGVIEVRNEDFRDGGIAYFLAGEKIRAKDLLYSGLVASSNTAMAALARSSGIGSENFIALMNQKAKKLGMENTRFKDPTGLDYHNISTASDIFLLAKEAFRRPEIHKATQLEKYEFRPIGKNIPRVVRNTNWLLNGSLNSGVYKVIGGKTGYIEESNYNLAVRVHNSEKNESVVVIILGSPDKQSRFSEARRLAEWAFNSYLWET